MATILNRTVREDIDDALRRLAEAEVEAANMRTWLEAAKNYDGTEQLGGLRAAARCGSIVAACAEQAKTHVIQAQGRINEVS